MRARRFAFSTNSWSASAPRRTTPDPDQHEDRPVDRLRQPSAQISFPAGSAVSCEGGGPIPHEPT